MNRNLISLVLIISLVGCVASLDFENGVEMRPGEKSAERLFEKGIGQPWVGGNPSSSNWGRGFDPFSYYNYQGKTYHRYIYGDYLYPGSYRYPLYYGYYPYAYRYYSYPYAYHSGYWWS
jgi:hypothetical protein